MAQKKSIALAPFAAIIGLAVVLQAIMIVADCRQTPGRVAKNFTKAYYYLDPSMQDYLCKDLAAEGELVDEFLHAKQTEASQRGLAVSYLRHKLMHLHAKVLEPTDTSAKVHLTGTSRVCINPAFMIIGKLFQLADEYPVDATIELVKEEGSWRVCGNPFGLNPEA